MDKFLFLCPAGCGGMVPVADVVALDAHGLATVQPLAHGYCRECGRPVCADLAECVEAA